MLCNASSDCATWGGGRPHWPRPLRWIGQPSVCVRQGPSQGGGPRRLECAGRILREARSRWSVAGSGAPGSPLAAPPAWRQASSRAHSPRARPLAGRSPARSSWPEGRRDCSAAARGSSGALQACRPPAEPARPRQAAGSAAGAPALWQAGPLAAGARRGLSGRSGRPGRGRHGQRRLRAGSKLPKKAPCRSALESVTAQSARSRPARALRNAPSPAWPGEAPLSFPAATPLSAPPPLVPAAGCFAPTASA